MNQPLVTAICPTVCPAQDRFDLLRAAISQFQHQDYQNKELIILYTGTPGAGKLLTEDPAIFHIGICSGEPLGEKRNIGCGLARGEIICHWDDDDWYFPQRISGQVQALFDSGADVTGYGDMLFADPADQFAVRYDNHLSNYVVGTSLMYRKSYWQEHQFDPRAFSEDNDFVRLIPEGKLHVKTGDQIVARLHVQQTCTRPRKAYYHGDPWQVVAWPADARLK